MTSGIRILLSTRERLRLDYNFRIFSQFNDLFGSHESEIMGCLMRNTIRLTADLMIADVFEIYLS